MTGFDWTAKNVPNRKAVAYAAVSAQEHAETYEQFQAVTSGYNSPRSYELWHQRQRDMAANLFSIAVRGGFIDC